MATVQEAVRRLTVESTSRGVTETTDKLRQLGQAQRDVTVTSQQKERATQSMERRLQSIQRQYDQNFRATEQLARVQRDLDRAMAQGLVTKARYNELMSLAAARHSQAAAAAGAHRTALTALAGQMSIMRGMAAGAVMGGVAGLVGGAIGALTGGQFISATAENEKVMAQLEAAIRSTGGAAGFTASQLAQMASALQGVTTFGDETIMSAQGVLLTFTRIGREVFPQALEAILNVSTAMNQDLKSSTVQIGKALNDPIAGLTALSRVGIQFSKEQKDQIRQFQEAGNVMAAQKVILAELEVQFGGSARAARDTLGGALTSLKNAFGDLFEAPGPAADRLRESVERLTKLISDPGFISAIQSVGAALFNMFAGALEAGQRLGYVISQFRQGDFSALTINTATPEGQMAAARRDLAIGIGGRMTTRDVGSFYDVTGAAPPVAGGPRGAQPSGIGGETSAAKRNEFDKATDSLRKQTEALQIQISTFGLSTEAAARYKAEQELLNAAAAAGVPLTESQRAAISATADAYAAATVQLEEMRKAQQRADEINNLLRDTFKGFVSDLRSGLQEGMQFWDAFAEAATKALNRITDKLIDMAINQLWQNAFPTGGGGVFGLGGGATASSGAYMMGGVPVPVFHAGGVVGASGGARRYIHPAYFDDAPRYHFGGIAGLRPNEVPAILERGETVVPRGRGDSPQSVHVTVGVSVDRSGNLQAYVTDVARGESAIAARAFSETNAFKARAAGAASEFKKRNIIGR